MVFIYSFDGIFLEQAIDDQQIDNKYIGKAFLISDPSCETQNEFEKKYVFNKEAKSFSINVQDPVPTAQELLEVLQATKNTLKNEIEEYATNRLAHGIDINGLMFSATDTCLNKMMLTIYALENGVSSPLSIATVDGTPVTFIDVHTVKEIFCNLMLFANSVFCWKNAIIKDIDGLTALPLIEQYQEKISFI